MSKAFTREADDGDDGPDEEEREDQGTLPAGSKNYLTPGGHQRLKAELHYLLNQDRPAVTAVVSWAAKNGDRSENADYQYGKRRLREIDRRIRFLSKRLDRAEVIDPGMPRTGQQADRVFFGATVTYAFASGERHTITIVGVDEVNLKRNHVSWISPLARALMKAQPGDTVVLKAPAGDEDLEVIEVKYLPVAVDPYVPTAVTLGGEGTGGK